jgi:aspartate beta-hydroxylase
MSEAETSLWNKIDLLLKDYHLNNFQKVACKKFIKDKVGNPDNKDVDRLRDWLFMKMNGQRLPKVMHPRQLGCPDLVPGLSLKAWWERDQFEWIG